MLDKFNADTFRLDNAMCDFITEVAGEKIQEFEFIAEIGGRKVAASVAFNIKEKIIIVNVETPVKFLQGE